MRIITDTREQVPFSFEKYKCEQIRGTLPTGDYSLAGLEDRVAMERKSLDDLIGCLMGAGRERFERELARAAALDRFAVVVEAGLQDVAQGRYLREARERLNAITKAHGLNNAGQEARQ